MTPSDDSCRQPVEQLRVALIKVNVGSSSPPARSLRSHPADAHACSLRVRARVAYIADRLNPEISISCAVL